MKLKRGDTRSDGMIYWGKHSNYSNGEYWVSKEQFERSRLLKKKRYDKKNELLNLKNNLLVRGFVREDGMVFWGYHPDCKNGEKWMSEDDYNKNKLDKQNKILKAKKINGVKRRGDTREDGMIFLCYSPSYENGERWVTKKIFESLRKKQKIASKKFYWKNPENIREQVRKWRLDNPNVSKEYFQKNKKEIYNARNKRIKNNPLFALRMSIHNIIKNSISKLSYTKNSKTADILGCSFEEFKAYIESQFKAGMSWENRHLWHIDHIMPVSMAKTYDEVVRLNHYKNLRPLWAHENLTKSNKTPDILVLF